MDYHPHIVLVNTHTEGVCSHHDPAFFLYPCILFLVPDFLKQPGMIIVSADLVFFQEFGDEFRLPAVPNV